MGQAGKGVGEKGVRKKCGGWLVVWLLVCGEGGERDSEQWEQNQDVLFKLIARVRPGQGMLWYATG